ncbi:MAG: hypothetical protein HY814_07385 [Candidatus Riflebacteria bacterium]|nr:hypothetical protein [Candidatus Riflebacteria bacterium]
MKRTNCSNPNGLGFSELMLCPDAVFTQVCSEIEAGRFHQAKALLQLTEPGAECNSLAQGSQAPGNRKQ